MRQLKGNGFTDRQKDSADAKKQLLSKFKAAPKPDDPEMAAKRAEREALVAARELRHAERARLKEEKAAREKAEAEAIENAVAIARAKAEAKEAEDQKSRIERVIADEAERKAERDRRYAARKARQR